MVTLRALTAADAALIHHWPHSPPGLEELDYALRPGGWPAEYHDRPGTRCFVAEIAGDAIGSSILARTSEAEAEFRIALRADRLGRGLGAAIASMTLATGFGETRRSRIHLIVRLNLEWAIRLHRRLGFVKRGECLKNINGPQTRFLIMDRLRDLPRIVEPYA